MLFNSIEFILFFLPITLAGLYFFGSKGSIRLAMSWLVLSSSVFYAWFSIKFLIMLWVLIIFNFFLGCKLSRDYKQGLKHPLWLAFGIVVNLSVLGYFKYTNFLISNMNVLFGTGYVLHKILLPIGISFFTFQKIGYLVDAYRGLVREYDFISFCLFVLFFPQLIAGPIVHHKEIIPQFHQSGVFRFSSEKLATGILLFSMGLIKKVCIADNLAEITDAIFLAATQSSQLSLIDAWQGALSFTFQIYFDFSGYTDMALGLAMMCGILLPLNFNSPYMANNIIDFWRRWHMSLSRFMRDYIYVSLGGNRHGRVRRYRNLLLTMLIGGLWHGASWTFVVWGGLHGCYLVINHGWQAICSRLGWFVNSNVMYIWVSRLLTFIAVVLAWIFFRAEGFHVAMRVLSSMFGLNGIANLSHCIHFKNILLLLALFVWVSIAPNSQTIVSIILSELKLMRASWLSDWSKSLYPNGKSGSIALAGGHVIGALIGGGCGLIILAILIYQSTCDIKLHQFIYFQF